MRSIVLVNLGSPKSYKPLSVWRYLTEFLTDPLVIEEPFWKRQLLVRGIIVPARFRQSAKAYKQIWTPAGSPLITWGEKVRDRLSEALGAKVYLAMRYQQPSLRTILTSVEGPLTVVPLFPQYADATSGSIAALVKRYRPDASLLVLQPDHPTMIRAMAAQVSGSFDHLCMSFHGLPVRQDRGYKEQCLRTATALAAELRCPYTLSFQSRLGKEPWLGPYTSDVLAQSPGRTAVISPSFVADCLETLYELGIEYRSLYSGPLIPCMNDHPLWIQSLAEQITG